MLDTGGRAATTTFMTNQIGDVLVTFEVEPDRFFGRDGLDITCEIPISLEQAVLGASVQVSTVHGGKVKLKVPAGTQPGKKFRVRGQGVEKDGQRGDLIVEISIAVPEKLSEEQERMMKEFAAAGGLKY